MRQVTQAQYDPETPSAFPLRAGSVDVILATLSELPSLTFMDFTSQNLYGALPNNITFPRLEYLGLRHNQLQACLAVCLPFRSALQCKATAAGLTSACCGPFPHQARHCEL